MRKILLPLFLVLICITGGIFSACGTTYDDIELSIDKSNLTIYYEEPNADSSGEEATILNTVQLTATIDIDSDKISKSVIYDIEDKTIARVLDIKTEGNKTTATIQALKPGETKINVISAEGNKRASANLRVVLRASGMDFKADFSMAIAVGESKTLSNSYLDFYPSNTNQTGVNYSIEGNANGVSIEDNILSVSQSASTGEITIIATNSENEELTASTKVLIYNPILNSQISILDLDSNVSYNANDTLIIARNSTNNVKHLVVSINDLSYPFIAEIFSSDNRAISISKENLSNNVFTLVGVENGDYKATIVISLKGYAEQTSKNITLNVKVIDIVNKIYINNSSTPLSMSVYDIYTSQAESEYGSKITFNLSPNTSTYKTIGFYVEDEDLEKLNYLQFYSSNGQIIPNILSYQTSSNSSIRVKALQAVGESVSLYVVANSDFANGQYQVHNIIELNIKKGIEQVSFDAPQEYFDLSGGKVWQEYSYNINGIPSSSISNLDLSQLSVRSQMPSIIDAKMENGVLYLMPLEVGSSNIILQSVTGASATLYAKVVVVGTGVAIEVNSVKYRDYIAQTIHDFDTSLLTDIKASVGGMFYLEIQKYPTNLSTWSVLYSSSNSSVAVVSELGLVRVNGSGNTNLTVRGVYATMDGDEIIEKSFEQTIALQAFKAITEFNIGLSTASAYDVATIGYLDADQYSSVKFDAVISEAYIKKDEIRYKIDGDENPSNWLENNDGSRTYVGRNGYLIDYMDGTAKFIARLAENSMLANVKVTAMVNEFDRYYTSTCVVSITKATTLNNLYLVDYDARGVYFKAGAGLDTEDNSYQIQATTSPLTAVNSNLYYIAWDYDKTQHNALSLESTSLVVRVSESGLIVPMSVGTAKVRILPRSELTYDYNNDGKLSEREILQSAIYAKKFIDIDVEVADGTLLNPYRIYNATDFLNIVNGLDFHYVLASTIDLSGVTINSMGNSQTPFTGSLSGALQIGEKTIYNKLLNIKLNNRLEYDSSMGNQLEYGLFGKIEGQYDTSVGEWSYASISDIEMTFNYSRLILTGDLTSSQTIYFGSLAGILCGKIDNVNISINDYAIQTSTDEELVLGGIIGQNSQVQVNYGYYLGYVNSEITNCSLTANKNNMTLSLNDNAVVFGGVVGQNNAMIIGQSAFIEKIDDSQNDEYAFISFDGQTFDVDIMVKAIFANDNSIGSFGGVAGQNDGSIKNISSQGKLQIGDSQLQGGALGGIAGVNAGIINDVLSAMQLYGFETVGGIVGQNAGEITLARFEVFDTEIDEPILSAQSNLGGVAGINQGNISYSYFECFRSDESYFALTGQGNVGGVVGLSAEGKIQSSWANASISASSGDIGGFIGSLSNTTIENSYSVSRISGSGNIGGFIGNSGINNSVKNAYSTASMVIDNVVAQNFISAGNLSAENSFYLGASGVSGGASARTKAQLKNASTFSAWNLGFSVWRMDSNINEGYPYIVYNYQSQSYNFISEAPEEILVEVKDTVDNKFVKVDSDKAIVMLNKVQYVDGSTSQTANYIQPINLIDLINFSTTPTLSGKVLLDAIVVEGQDVVAIDGGVLYPLSRGLATIKIVSKLNRDAYDLLQVYIVPGVSEMTAYINGQQVDEQEYSMRKGTSQKIEFNFKNIVDGFNADVNNQVGIAWSNLGDIANMSSATKIGNTQFVGYQLVNILSALSATDSVDISMTGYVDAIFYDVSNEIQATKILLPWLSQTFPLSIYEGLSDFTLSQSKAVITPNDSFILSATISTDIESDYISSINIIDDNGNEVQTISLTQENGQIILSQSEIGQTPILNASLIERVIDAENSGKIIFRFEFIPNESVYRIEEQQSYTLNFVASSLVNEEIILTKSFGLTINPQPILKLSMLHFQDFRDGDIASDEMSTDTIACGNLGLLKLNIYPYFSNVDYLELTCNNIDGNIVGVMQQVYDARQGRLVNLRHSGNLIDGGIRVELITGYDINGKSYFNGDLWIKTLLNIDVEEDTEFILTANAFINQIDEPIFTNSLSLYTEFAPSVKIIYPDNYAGQIALGTTTNFEIAVKTDGGKLSLSYQVLDENGQAIEDFDTTKISALFGKNGSQSSYYNFNGKFMDNLSATLWADILNTVGNTIELTATLTTTIDNIPYVRTSVFNIVISKFIVQSVYIASSESGTLDMAINRTTNLLAKSNVVKYNPADYVGETNNTILSVLDSINESINVFEVSLSRSTQVWYKRVYSSSTSKTDIAFLSSGESLTNYNYVRLNNVFVLYGKKISTDSIIALKVPLSYGFKDGVYQVYIDSQTPMVELEWQCNLNITDNSTEDNPTPIYDLDGFKNMTEGVHYILMNNIVLENWLPMKAVCASLDGNGKLIQLRSFDLVNLGNNMLDYVGVFSTVSENTILKNLIIDIRELLNDETTATLNLTNKQQVYFGVLAGQNYGVITNCEIMNINSAESEQNANNFSLTINTSLTYQSGYTDNIIGTLVGVNTGYITNSRVGRITDEIGDSEYLTSLWGGQVISELPIKVQSTSTFGGLVGHNGGVVSSCYVDNLYIQNISVIGVRAKTAGLVAINATSGRITSSYARGYNEGDELSPNIISYGNIGAFVLTNDGTIKDCYAEFTLKTPATSAGFVFENNGTIKYCYTLSRFFYEESEDDVVKNNSSFRAFTGVDDYNEILNSGTIEYSYYKYNNKDYKYSDEPAIDILDSQITDQSSFVGFAYSMNAIGQGIWEFEPETTPSLVSANQIAVSVRELVDVAELEDSDIYVYSYKPNFEIGTIKNPMLVSNAEIFNNYFKVGNSTNSTSYISQDNVRIIRDINFYQTSATAGGLHSSLAIYKGTLDGNGMNLTGITLTGEYTEEQEASASSSAGVTMSQKEEFGLFARLDSAVVKNVNLNYEKVSATEFSIVGALTGVATDSLILGVDITGAGIVVQGRNIVGGVVGLALGNTQLQNISSNISATATYRNDESQLNYELTMELDSYSLYDVYSFDGSSTKISLYQTYLSENNLPNLAVSYVGGIVGVAVMGEETKLDTQIRTLKVYGPVLFSAERTGGIIGYNSKYCLAYDLNFELFYDGKEEYEQSIAGVDFAGGIVGENYGNIEKARLDYHIDYKDVADAVQMGKVFGATNLFTGISNYQGTVIGKNIGGTISSSYSRANLINANAKYVGLVAGYVQGGDYSEIYVTGDLQAGSSDGTANKSMGGAFCGYINGASGEISGISSYDNIKLVANYSFETNSLVSSGKFSLGAFAGYSNATFSEIFEQTHVPVFANQSNFATQNIYPNVQYKVSSKLNFVANMFASATTEQYNIMNDIPQEDEREDVEHISTGLGQFINSQINSSLNALEPNFKALVDDCTPTFADLNSDNWVYADFRFPILRITHKQTAIIINESNKTQFGQLLERNINGYFVVRVDVDFNEQDGVQYKTIGTSERPFKGTIIGSSGLIDNNGNRRYPQITLPYNTTLFDYVDGMSLYGIEFVGNGLNYMCKPDELGYTSLVVNQAKNSSFQFIKIHNITANITINNSRNGADTIFGALIAYSENSKLSNIDIAGNYTLGSAQNYGNLKFGGAVGKMFKQTIVASTFSGSLTATNMTVSSLNIGTLIGEAQNISAGSISSNPATFNLKINSITGEICNIGGIIGQAINSTLLASYIGNVENYNGNITIISTLKDGNNFNLGGVVGSAENSNLDQAISFMPISLTINNKQASSNIGGVAGYFYNTKLTSSSYSSSLIVSSTGSKIDNQFASVGGLIGYAFDSQGKTLSSNYFSGQIKVNGIYYSNVGGLIGSQCATNSVPLIIYNSYYDGKILLGQSGEGNNFSAMKQNVGGIIGQSQNIKMQNVFAVGYIHLYSKLDASVPTYNDFAGGLIGSMLGDKNAIINSYANVYFVMKNDINRVLARGLVGSVLELETLELSNAYYVRENSPQEDINAVGNTSGGKSLNELLNAFSDEDWKDAWGVSWRFAQNRLPILSFNIPNGYLLENQGSLYYPFIVTQHNIYETLQNLGAYHYALASDIELQLNGAEGEFSGVLNGNGYTITLLDAPTLFTRVAENAFITNLNIQVEYSTSSIENKNIGAIAGENDGFINYVGALGDINVSGSLNQTSIGGIAGVNLGYIGHSQSFINISCNGTSNSKSSVGGIAGTMGATSQDKDYPYIINSFNSGDLKFAIEPNDSYLGGIVGKIYRGRINGVYVNGIINQVRTTLNQDYGAIYGKIATSDTDFAVKQAYNDAFATLIENNQEQNLSKASALNIEDLSDFATSDGIWQFYANENPGYSKAIQVINYGYPYLKYHSAVQYDYMKCGTGAKNDTPIYIKSQSGLRLINAISSKKILKNYIIIKDFTCIQSGVVIDIFRGTLYGDNHTIYNLDIMDNVEYLGFIGRNEGSIYNLNINSIKVTIPYSGVVPTITSAVGAFIALNNGFIKDCKIDNITIFFGNNESLNYDKGANFYLGGVIGLNMSDSTSKSIEGIMASNVNIDLQNKKLPCEVGYLGGFIGGNGTDQHVVSGNIVGCQLIDVTIINSSKSNKYVDGSVGFKYYGGFAGLSRGQISECLVKGSSTMYISDSVTESRIGGFVGSNSHIIYNSYTTITMNLYGNNVKNGYYGGFLGATNGMVYYSYSTSKMNFTGRFGAVESGKVVGQGLYHSFCPYLSGGALEECMSDENNVNLNDVEIAPTLKEIITLKISTSDRNMLSHWSNDVWNFDSFPPTLFIE